ncbi:MAG: LON peptidase substrate-binding domain-containing protein [Planctomycetota bacterium]|jgi:Lon protease-like protein
MSGTDEPLPVDIPLFPLPNVVLFPSAVVPLHIFEPRYRLMVQRCLDGDGVFGMVLLRPEPAQDERPPADGAPPPIHHVGAAGRIVGHQPLPDGRSHILVQGLQRFRVGDLGFEEPYLTARVAYLRAPALSPERDAALYAQLLDGFEGYLRCCSGDTARAQERVRETASAPVAADFIASCLDLSPARRQALLELIDPEARAQQLLAAMREAQEQHALATATRRAGWPPPGFSAN